jgi:hypothetical protein
LQVERERGLGPARAKAVAVAVGEAEVLRVVGWLVGRPASPASRSLARDWWRAERGRERCGSRVTRASARQARWRVRRFLVLADALLVA